jgi:nicotinamidase-related amidase
MQNMEKDFEFLDYIESWQKTLPALKLFEVLKNPSSSAITSIDLTNGFCNSGALASPRVRATVQPACSLFTSAWELGLRHIVLLQDTHDQNAVEFAQWPPHCVKGTAESEAVAEIRELPFYPQMLTFAKNSIHPALNTGFQNWLDAHPEIETFIVIGDCTDLCTYQLAMHLRLDANAHQRQRRVIASADCIQTYDFPVAAAKAVNAMPHPGDLMHKMFLYHMALNGVEVVRSLEAK